MDEGSEQITVSAEASAKAGELPVAPAVIGEVLEPGHDVLIDDGLVRLRVERKCAEGSGELRRACSAHCQLRTRG